MFFAKVVYRHKSYKTDTMNTQIQSQIKHLLNFFFVINITLHKIAAKIYY